MIFKIIFNIVEKVKSKLIMIKENMNSWMTKVS
jgi:hypothetical protein